MIQIPDQNKESPTWISILSVFAVCFGLKLLVSCTFFRLGQFGGDSGYYIENAHEILQNGLGYYLKHIRTPYYWGYPTFLASLIGLVGENFTMISIVQIMISALSAVFLYIMAYDFSSSGKIAAFLSIFYAIIIDVVMWDCRILSDSLGASLELFTVYCFWSFRRMHTRISLLLFLVVAFAFFTTRTNSISLLLVLSFFLIMDLPKEKKRVAFILIAIAGIGLAAWYSSSKSVQFGLPSRVSYYSRLLNEGKVVPGRPQYDHPIPAEHAGSWLIYIDYLIVLLKRLFYYWSIYFGEYSLSHKLYCLVSIFPVFVISIPAAIWIIKGKNRLLYPYLYGILSYCFIQVLTEVDYDMRYRMPIFMLLIICCSAWLGEHMRKKIK